MAYLQIALDIITANRATATGTYEYYMAPFLVRSVQEPYAGLRTPMLR